MLPKCLALLVHFNTTLFINSVGGSLLGRGRPLNKIHTVFLALNSRSNSCANDSQIWIIDFKQAKFGAKKAKSSAEHSVPNIHGLHSIRVRSVLIYSKERQCTR